MQSIDGDYFSNYFKYDESSPSCLRWNVTIMVGKNKNRAIVRVGDVAGTLNKITGYWQVRLKQKTYRIHRIIYLMHNKIVDPFIIDHIDGNKQNNRISNLRIASREDNAKNKIHKSSNSLPYTHISDKLQRVQVTTVINGKRLCKTFPFSVHGQEGANEQAKLYLINLLPDFIKNGYTERQIQHIKDMINDSNS